MAETTQAGLRSIGQRLIPNELLAGLSALLAMAAIVAIARGRPDWANVPALVWAHLVSVVVATGMTPIMLMRRKGDRRHRRLGYVWVAAMLFTAVTSLFFNTGVAGGLGVFTGDFSVIHLLSLFVLVMVPTIVVRARNHDRLGHEGAVRGMVIGALLIAGFFTFPFNRMLGQWLLG